MKRRQAPIPVWAFGYLFRVTPSFPAKQRVASRFERLVADRGYLATIKFDRGQRISLDLIDWLPRQLFMTGNYELPFSTHFCNALRAGMTVFDVGAHIGVYTLLAAPRVGERGRVHAFEPSSASFGNLRRNIGLNSFRNVIPVNMAAWRETGERHDLYLSDRRSSGLSSLAEGIRDPSGESEAVATIAIDDYFERQDVDKLDVMKIDAEGSELQILRGARRILTEFSPTLFVEIINDRLSQQGALAGDVFSFLRDLGYMPFRLDGSAPQPIDLDLEEDAALVMFQKADSPAS